MRYNVYLFFFFFSCFSDGPGSVPLVDFASPGKKAPQDEKVRSQDSSHDAPVEKKPANEMPTPTFVYVLAALATIGGFLFGYDIGIVAGSMLFIQPYFEAKQIQL